MNEPGASLQQLELLFRQLATAARAGLPFRDALAIMRHEDDRGRYGLLLGVVATSLDRGGNLASALAETGRVFPPETLDFIRRAEASGMLPSALDALATDYGRRAVAQRALNNALAYPLAMAIMLVLVLSMIMAFVMPAFTAVYADFGELPGITRALIGFTDFFMFYLLVPVLILAAVAAWIYFFRESVPPRLRDACDSMHLRIPVFGTFGAKLLEVRSAGLLGVAAAGDRQFAAAALAHLDGTAGNRRLAKWVQPLARRVSSGEELFGAVRATPEVPRRIATILELGSKTSDIQAAREQLESWYDAELETGIRSFKVRVLVLSYVLLGTALCCILIAVYLPIFRLGSVI